jgi:glycosyltransferase involved in cell wall biosynthesis
MKILQAHNRYQTRGGEDAVVELTLRLLEAHGQEALLFEKDSSTIGGNFPGKMKAMLSGVYSFSAAREMEALLRQEQPDIVHVHNLLPLISPSVLRVCRKAGVPAVMTVHNYRLICPIAVFFRDNQICEACSGGRQYMCLIHNCRESAAESAAYALRGWLSNVAGFYRRNISRYLAISPFLKARLVREGYPEDRIDVVPNTIAVPEECADASRGGYVAFAGRMSAEKGIPVLLEAARQTPDIAYRLAGEGPLAAQLKQGAPPNAAFSGLMPRKELMAFYHNARMLVVPSVWQETFGLVAVEAMARAVPVIVSRIGGLRDLVEDGVTGFHFTPGDSNDLADKIRQLWTDPGKCRQMGLEARERVKKEYNEALHYERLIAVYEKAARDRQ